MITEKKVVQPFPITFFYEKSFNGTDNNDTIHGTDKADLIRGFGGDDRLYGEDGNDYVDAGDGNDAVNAGNGNDVIVGGAGNNSLQGGAGNDLFIGGAGNDTIYGGDGFDTLSYARSTSKVWIDAGTGQGFGTGDAHGDTISGIEKIVGSNYDDALFAYQDASASLSIGSTLDGGAGADMLYGRGENDTLFGGAGDDVIQGGGGNDLVTGGLGADNLSGGADRDTFVFAPGGGMDRLPDFQSGIDKIDLTAFRGHGQTGNAPWNAFGSDGILAKGSSLSAAQHYDSSDHFFYNTTNHTLYEVAHESVGPVHYTVQTAVAELANGFGNNIDLIGTDFIV